MPSVSVIIVSYKVRHYIEQCVMSVMRSVPDAQVIIVDNNSDDGSVEFLSQRFPSAHIIANKENVGFGKANNMALPLVQAQYVLFLNPDTVVAENTIPDCIGHMDGNPETGAIGVRMQYGNGRFALESRRSVPTPAVSFFHMTGLGRLFPKSHVFARYHLGYMDNNEPCQIEVVSGAFMFVRKSVLDRVGGFDENFFMYGEDIDLSYRILQAGYSNWYIPSAIVHYKGESTVKTSYRYAKVFYNAMLVFYDKHYGKANRLFSLLVRIVVSLKKIVTYITQNIAAGGQRLSDAREDCVFLGKGANFDSASEMVRFSRSLKNMTLLEPCESLDSVRLEDLSGKQAIVFDVSEFRYSDIFKMMGSLADRGVLMTMALYNPESGHIISEDEVL